MEEVRTMHGWDVFAKKTGKRSIHDYLKTGDTVSEDIVRYLINIVPPWNLKEGYFQVGTQKRLQDRCRRQGETNVHDV